MTTAMYDTPPVRTKPRRKDLGPGEILCSHCGAKCCRYFALPIDTPTERQDFEYIRWYLLHERATVFTEDDSWYLLVHNKCKLLGEDNLCGAYETRPGVCREYTTKKCEYEDDWVYDRYFETPEQVLQYTEAILKPRKGRDHRSPKPEPFAKESP